MKKIRISSAINLDVWMPHICVVQVLGDQAISVDWLRGRFSDDDREDLRHCNMGTQGESSCYPDAKSKAHQALLATRIDEIWMKYANSVKQEGPNRVICRLKLIDPRITRVTGESSHFMPIHGSSDF